jgi:hypothetical protein
MAMETNSLLVFLDVLMRKKSDRLLGHTVYSTPTSMHLHLHASLDHRLSKKQGCSCTNGPEHVYGSVWIMKKSIWDTYYFSAMSTVQLGSMVFFTQSKLQTGRSKPGLVIIPHMHSSSGKIRNCLPRGMTVNKTYWSYTV